MKTFGKFSVYTLFTHSIQVYTFKILPSLVCLHFCGWRMDPFLVILRILTFFIRFLTIKSFSNGFQFLRNCKIPLLAKTFSTSFSRSKIMRILKQILFLILYLRTFLVKQVSLKNYSLFGLSLWRFHWFSDLDSAPNLHNFCIVVK